MRTFTPGPWHVESRQGDRVRSIATDRPNSFGDGPESLVMTGDASEADGRLIAAAPDLLTVLERLVRDADRPAEGGEEYEDKHTGERLVFVQWELVEAARAALAKAEG